MKTILETQKKLEELKERYKKMQKNYISGTDLMELHNQIKMLEWVLEIK